jgi:PST family polysaccharide transporter
MTAVTTSTLRQRAVRSAAWTLPTSVGTRALGLLGTLLLARYLAPNEYGVVMAAVIVATTASSATTFGVGIYLVANPEISRAERFHASCWFLATGVAALLATMLLAGPLERWSGAPGLARFLPVLILSTFLERIYYVPERILVRNLRFRRLSLGSAAGELTYTVVTITCAAYGAGAMAIAWGSLARSVVRFAAVVPAVDIREWLQPHRLHLATLRGVVGHGVSVSVATILAFGVRRWDNLLISRYFGAGSMGAYNYAYNLADTPATAIGDQLSDIVAASFPHVDQRRRAEALVNACTLVSMILFPLSIGLAAVAPTVVATFFDPRWSDVAAMLMALAALSIARPPASILASYFYASRRPGVVLGLECATLVGLVAAIPTVGRAGINWACACVGAVFALRTLGGLWVVRRQDGVPLSAFLLPMAKPLAVCIVMAAGVSAARLELAGLTPPIRLLVEIAVGAAIYVGGVLLVARSSCHELLHAVRAALPRGSVSPPEEATEKAATPNVLSLSTEFPNPLEPGKGLFVRSRLDAMASRTRLLVVSPVASLDYANPQRNLFAALGIPRQREDGRLQVLHPRWLYPPYGGWTNAFFLFARLLPLLARLRARRRFDAIDAHFAHPEGIAAVLLGLILDRPVLVTLRGSELRYYRQRSKRFWMSWALQRADRVIAVSDGLHKLAIDLGVDPRRVRTVPNGVSADVFFPRNRLACRARHGLAHDDRIILSAGDLAELKGHHRAIAAVKVLNDRGVRARLLIAGGVGRSGRHAEALRRQVTVHGLRDRVAFLGEVTQETLAELMSAADVFCLASSTEGWPNVVNEALACGTPVVATDVGAVRQMLVSDRYGYVVPVHDGAALAEALRAALTGQWDREAISARGRSRSWSHAAEDVLEEMQAVMAERARLRDRLPESAEDMNSWRALRSRLVRMGRA